MIRKANCKINLGLDVLRRREDGYHELETVMFPVRGLFDEVEVLPSASAFTLRSEGLTVDCDPEENICMKACRLMQRHYGIAGAEVRLRKRVPFGAGLGGGSSSTSSMPFISRRRSSSPGPPSWGAIRPFSCAIRPSSARVAAR